MYIQICAWPLARESSLPGWPATGWNGCWWMSPPFPLARLTWESAEASLIRIVITPSFLATHRCPSLVPRPTQEPNEVLCRMSLDVDGILHVTAIEKETGKSKHISIARALREKSPAE